MGIIKPKPVNELPVYTPPPSVVDQSAAYKSIAVDNSKTPVQSLVAYLEGMPWTVDYFNQLIGKHNDLREVDPGQNAANQQYVETLELELRVNSALQTSYDQESGVTTVVGSATIIHMVPNVSDYFLAEAGERDKAIFKIDSVERRTFNRDSVYLINYSLVCYARDNEELYTDIKAKVVRTYHFSKSRLTEGLSPVLKEDDYQASVDLSQEYKNTIARYFRTFFNRSMMTIFVPGQQSKVYDAGLVKFLSCIIESFEAPEMRDMRMVSMDHDRYMEQGNLWKALLSRDYGELSRVHQKAILAPRGYFNRSSWMKGPIYWNIDNYVYPLIDKDDTFIEGLNRVPPPTAVNVLESQSSMEVPPWSLTNVYKLADGEIPLVKSVLVDDYYVLSQAFYQGQPDLSALEILVRDYLKSQTLDLKMLAALMKAYPDWPVLERYYYGPLLILLLKDSIRGFYL